MPASPTRPVLGIINSSPEICALLATVFTEEGFRVVTTSPLELKHGAPTPADFLTEHRPVAVIYDIALPYEENWRFFRSIEESEAGQQTRFVLTCINKRALEGLVGATPTHELIGKPYDLDQIVAAVRRASDADEPPPR
jgi:DNA-binding response OmpR family regulator